jgi:hypothetical protein
VLQSKQNVAYLSEGLNLPGLVEPNPEFYVRLGELARRTAAILGDQDAFAPASNEGVDPKQRARIERNEPKLGVLWQQLGSLCDRLETLAHKQLRGAAFSKRDEEFLRGYGIDLAGIMLYGGNSYMRAKDDAPRVVDVFTNPVGSRRYLEVGIGRPRALFVLYPFRGQEILCRGAVLPYHEFHHPTRLDDHAWKKLLDSRDPPKPPSWLRPILAGLR